jgi:cytochrome P450
VPDQRQFPLGAAVTIEQLDRDPHPVLARLREREPVSWVPAIGGWLVTTHAAALTVMRDADTFTVDDSRFSTAQVIGPSMLSLDGQRHDRHRTPFALPFRPASVRERFAAAAIREAEHLVEQLESEGSGELRRLFAGPLAATIVGGALGLEREETGSLLGWYDAIVGAVTAITAGSGSVSKGEQAFAELRDRLSTVIDSVDRSSALGAAASAATLTRDQLVSNAAVLLFGGIETTEGMIANALLQLLERPDQLQMARADPKVLEGAIEESLRLEPAAAVIDRYATGPSQLEAASIESDDLVRVSISAANRDPAVFPDPDQFDPGRPRRHLAFAHGPHVCLGVHLARLEARVGIGTLLQRLPQLRLDPERPAEVTGLVFRKPQTLSVLW